MKRVKKRRTTGKTHSLPETKRLVEIVHILRRECPWDRKQTHRSLVPYLLEEAYETVDAIESRKSDSLREELGDLLLQVVLHAELCDEKGEFSFEDVARGIGEKMVRRHPHVFEKRGKKKSADSKEHQKNWTRLKSKEKPGRSLLGGIPHAMPALQLAQRYGEIASSVGFDWSRADEVLEKVDEELGELRKELRRASIRRKSVEMELGDLLFTLASLARHLNVNAEGSLKMSAAKFSSRFTALEKRKKAEGRPVADCSAEELDAAWNQVKKKI